ncbi:MAG: TonB-dependent receptor plug domain-containing protein [Flavobacteriales bacterium]|nr:TonB-dependent receptor plug domain-containing protein [Flavobacteriales bacterium]
MKATILISVLAIFFIACVQQQGISESKEVTVDDKIQVGYGTVSAENNATSTNTLKAKELNKGNVINPAQMLTGKIPGVSVTNSGNPSVLSKIRIRGGSSLLGSNDPLVVLDGLILGEGIDILNSLNPNDIEDITILKDAASTAIYGSRGANGVIIITSKKP